jgi:NADH:ubiquinone oxidoreductase subunit 5 (subunit L)/multisubunit Na+/H+ antiporter MnhA subunit
MTRQHNPFPGTSSIISISEFPPERQSSEEQPPRQEHVAKPSKLLLPVAIVLLLILAFYGLLLYQGLPQQWTELSNAVYAEKEYTDHDAEQDDRPLHPPYYMVLPFVVLLLCIAILPLIPATAHWWEKNRNKLLVAGSLGLLTLLYYCVGCDVPVEQHLVISRTHWSC